LLAWINGASLALKDQAAVGLVEANLILSGYEIIAGRAIFDTVVLV
jgi:hypothetical protein